MTRKIDQEIEYVDAFWVISKYKLKAQRIAFLVSQVVPKEFECLPLPRGVRVTMVPYRGDTEFSMLIPVELFDMTEAEIAERFAEERKAHGRETVF